MNEIILTGIISAITGTVSAWVSWFFARKKYNSEVDLNLVEKMEKSLQFYENLSSDNRARLEAVTQRNNELEKEVQELRKQVLDLTMNICMNLTCTKRIIKTNKTYEKKDRKLEKSNNSTRGCESN